MTAPKITQVDVTTMRSALTGKTMTDARKSADVACSIIPDYSEKDRPEIWLAARNAAAFALATQRQSYEARIAELEARCEAVRLKSLEFASDATRHRNQRDAAEIAAQHSQTRALAAEAKLAEAREGAEIWQIIKKLTFDEGASLNVLCPNPDFNGLPDYAIEINNEATGWEDKRFSDDSQIECFRHAARFMEGNGDG